MTDTAFLACPLGAREGGADAHLVQIHPRELAVGRRFAVGHESVVIGRDAGCGAYCPHPSVSRTHARVGRRPDGGFEIVDLGSTNGTFVNEVRVRAHGLRDGDNVRTGDAVYRFLAPGNVECRYHEEVHRLAARDPLTGLLNHRALMDALTREVVQAAERRRPLALAILDIDHFKAVNDRLGHAAGDAALRTLAGLVPTLIREEDVFARYGGEEFALALPGTDLESAGQCAERVRAAVEAQAFASDGAAFRVTVSLGVTAVRAGEWVAPSQFVRLADEQLYRAKRLGRNRVCSSEPDAESLSAAPAAGWVGGGTAYVPHLGARDQPPAGGGSGDQARG